MGLESLVATSLRYCAASLRGEGKARTDAHARDVSARARACRPATVGLVSEWGACRPRRGIEYEGTRPGSLTWGSWCWPSEPPPRKPAGRDKMRKRRLTWSSWCRLPKSPLAGRAGQERTRRLLSHLGFPRRPWPLNRAEPRGQGGTQGRAVLTPHLELMVSALVTTGTSGTWRPTSYMTLRSSARSLNRQRAGGGGRCRAPAFCAHCGGWLGGGGPGVAPVRRDAEEAHVHARVLHLRPGHHAMPGRSKVNASGAGRAGLERTLLPPAGGRNGGAARAERARDSGGLEWCMRTQEASPKDASGPLWLAGLGLGLELIHARFSLTSCRSSLRSVDCSIASHLSFCEQRTARTARAAARATPQQP